MIHTNHAFSLPNVKANSHQGNVFSGYASLFNVPDLSGDRVMVGAFQRSLGQRGASGIRMLWNHDPAEPIGVWTDIHEDALGLHVEGHLTAGVERADGLAALLGDGAVDGLSIGFHTIRSTKAATGSGRRLVEVDLWEISLVAFPMQPGARVLRTASPPAGPLAGEQPTPSTTPNTRSAHL